ncbi:MAG: GNAT family N-acetyltransferase [Aquincola sp.]|nr:GNAT family N-acetyltransferase [Aquincola sp.]
MKLAALGPPVPITAEHNTALFQCRHESLNDWLRRRALANASSGATRTYVVCAEELRVVGYYALAAGSLDVQLAPSRLRRNMPNPLPVVVLGRLAVDDAWLGRGVGGGLLKDAVLRSLQAADLIGACALLCHAIDADAKAFYARHGFVESPTQELTMMLGLRH